MTQAERLDLIGQQAYDSWKGHTGTERKKAVLDLINKNLPIYSELLGIPPERVLEAWENARKVNVVNYYQESTFPDLAGVLVFDSVIDFKARFPSGKSICPACEGESTDFYECNSGLNMNMTKNGPHKPCNWKVYGLFGDMGKGIKVLIKDQFTTSPKPTTLFKPIELLENATT